MRKLRFPAGAVSVAVAMSLLFATSTYGQKLDEITVVARKTEENLQEVPLAINAIGAEELNRLGVRDLADLSQQDTSVQFDEGFTPSDTRITIRGLSPTRGRPNAAALIDGIDITSEAVSNAGGSLLIDPSIVDAQRVEIVKGPQSALYGRSAFAGAILYVSKDPADVFSGGVGIDYNLQGDEQITGDISLPVSDTFGIRINGRAFNSDGYYRNAATNELLGGGDGSGVALTLLWEPTDTLRAKWRTDYSDDQFDVVPQVLLNDWNKLYDLGNSGGLRPQRSNLAPLSGLRNALPGETADRAGCAVNGGFLDNYACGDGKVFIDYLTDPAAQDPFFAANNPPGSGTFDINDPWGRNIYNKQVVSVFEGKIPDGDRLQASINPDYRKVNNPILAEDFDGTQRIVFRNSLVVNWDITDRLAFASYSAFTDAKETTATDIGKFFRDNCRPGPNPAGLAPEFVPQTDCSGGDGIHDGSVLFFQDSENDTKQLSQEFRLAFDIRDDLKFTQGLQFWQEKVSQLQFNNSTITGGPVCYLASLPNNPGNISDGAINPLGSFLGLDQTLQCGNSSLPAAYWADETFNARPPNDIRRRTDHYSWYGQIQWDVTEKFRTTFEARYTREDNQVTGPTQFRCLNGLADQFLSNPDFFRDSVTGRELCQGFTGDNPSNFRNVDGSESAATTGPGTSIICGQVGRCEFLSQQPGNSFWDYGFAPQPGYDQTLNRTDRYWAPKATLEYFWNENILTYFSWSRGIKPGGFSLLTLGAFGVDANNDGDTSEIEFEQERLDVWEIGFKTDLFDNRVRWNGALYFQDFKDKQVTVQEVVGQTVGTRVRNIDGSEVLGFETDVSFQATDNLLLSGSYTFLESEYTDYTILTRSANDIARIQLGNGQGCIALDQFDDGTTGCVASFNGNELERAPKHAFSLDATYTNSLFDTGYEWFGTVNFRYQDSRWLEAFNIVELPEYMRTNVSLGITADTWDLQFYVNNVFDDDTVITGGANPGIPTASFGFGFESFNGLVPPGINAGPKLPSDAYANLPDPRLVGARINFRFGE